MEHITTGDQQVLLTVDSYTPTSDDFFTPQWVFDALALEFDVDVASPPGGVPYIPARSYYTITDDGLSLPWIGLVWCNPPFSVVNAWARKFAAHPDGIFLGPFSKSYWLADLLSSVDAMWVARHRIIFGRPVAETGDPSYHVFLASRGERATQGLRRLAALHEGALLLSSGT